MPEPQRPPPFDQSKIRFPSDAISLGAMRAADPDMFTEFALGENRCTAIDVLATHTFEQQLALHAFAKARGELVSEQTFDRAGILDTLDYTYRKYGLSSGIQQTRQLARDIEAAGAAQALSGESPMPPGREHGRRGGRSA